MCSSTTLNVSVVLHSIAAEFTLQRLCFSRESEIPAISGLASGSRRGQVTLPIVVGAFILGIVAVTGFFIGSTLPISRQAKSDVAVHVDPADLDFGEVFGQRQEHEIHLPISNPTTRDIQITGWSRGCSACTKVAPPTLVIPAGSVAEIAVELDFVRADAIRLQWRQPVLSVGLYVQNGTGPIRAIPIRGRQSSGG